MANKDLISDELLAAYLDGNTSEEETKQVLRALKHDKQLQEILNVALQTEDKASLIPLQNEVLPMLQMAALSGENICAVLCELFILQRHHIPYNEEELVNTAKQEGWLKPQGTPLYCIGNLLELKGLKVERKYDTTISDLRLAIENDDDVVVGVDREKLYADENDPEDLTNHAVVVTAINNDGVTIFDPYKKPEIINIPLPEFMDAWKESRFYMVRTF
ncbi:MAG: hypothetical protein E7101_10910 [Prevotella ruminicola]|uniref:Peptidase C39 domain-containing protein n=1 Tax=Xylanibacter ruminicola TaxID=839 RepID=A0A9D5S823_XYLRU|nr:hypothetical protein [Xylanibacter ruminicola]